MKERKTTSELRAKIRWGIIGIFALLLAASIFNMPRFYNKSMEWARANVGVALPTIPEKPFKLGLDLQGGVHLVYEADVRDVPAGEESEALSGVKDVIERRVNGIGVGEPNIQTTKVGNQHRLIVELPGVTDVKQAISMIGQTPILEFKEQNDVPPRDLTEEEKKKLGDFNKDAQKKAQDVLTRVKAGAEPFEEIAKQVSEDEESRKNNGGYVGFIARNDISAPVYDWAKTASTGTVSGLIENVEGYNIVKRGNEQEGQLTVSASHILLCHAEVRGCAENRTKDEARQLADELFEQANAKNFASLAKQYSNDVSSKEKGGVLTPFPKGMMVPEFEQAAFNADVGQIIGPVETQFGYHIIYKTGQETPKEYEISRILIRKMTETDILPPQDQWKSTGLSGKQLERAEVVSDQTTGQVQVSLVFDSEGAELFKQLTEKHLGDPIAIFLDGTAISAPTVQSVISDGRAVITGIGSIDEARLLAKRLNAGALPVPVSLISQQAIGPTLGAETLAASLKAGLVAFALVMLFMIVVYRLPGVLSVISLGLYVALTLALFKLLGVTLTLAGIAGFIMSLGVAIDANVLIFERLKEELGQGKSLKFAVEEGFSRAWTSIRDGNAATIITGLVLIWFGTSFVQGFAFTLIIGTLVSLFTAISVTRVMVRFIVPWFAKNNGGWLFLAKKNKS